MPSGSIAQALLRRWRAKPPPPSTRLRPSRSPTPCFHAGWTRAESGHHDRCGEPLWTLKGSPFLDCRPAPLCAAAVFGGFDGMDDRSNTIAGWVLGAGIVALGSSIVAGEMFHAERPEKMGYPIEGVEVE